MIEIQAKVKKLPGGWWGSFVRFFDPELRKADRDIKAILLHTSREEHNYKHETYNLRNATLVKGSLVSGKGLVLYVDINKAYYAQFIIRGFGGKRKRWNSDPFIDNAMAKHENYIRRRVERALSNSVVQFNRIK